jgi:triacylglycerol lipase
MEKWNEKSKGNDYPIILVHGYGGWGRDELSTRFGSLMHWGCFTDLQEELKAAGFMTHTPSMGAYSSNWDRTCELYAQLMNNEFVDYGEVHSGNFRHDRFKHNKYFNRKEMLLERPWSCTNKVNLICHSMGTPTARMLIQLLENGSDDEKQTPQERLSPLFAGGSETKGLVNSMACVVGINDGIVFFSQIARYINLQKVAVRLLSLTGIKTSGQTLFDGKLGQFGLKRREGEGVFDYLKRCKKEFAERDMYNTKDMCLHDLTSAGSYENNSWVRAQENVYYFCYAGLKTSPSKKAPFYHRPDYNKMAPILWVPALITGRYRGRLEHGIEIDEKWWPNDGVISVIAQKAPSIGSLPEKDRDAMVPFDPDNIRPGVWNDMGTLYSDHWDPMGFGMDRDCVFSKNNIVKFYSDLAGLLRSLPIDG